MKRFLSIMVLIICFSSTVLNGFAAAKTIDSILNGQEPTIELVNENVTDLVSYTTSKFKDVKASNWFAQSLAKLVGMKGIDGYKDKTFRPQNPISVAEFTKLLLAAAGYKQPNAKGKWYANYVAKAKELGVIESSDKYKYTEGMKRKDLAKMICKLLDVPPSTSTIKVFADAKTIDTKWIDAAFNEYIIRGYYKNGVRTFKPLQTATRAEVTEIVIRALEYKNDPVEYKRKMKEYYNKNEGVTGKKDNNNTSTINIDTNNNNTSNSDTNNTNTNDTTNNTNNNSDSTVKTSIIKGYKVPESHVVSIKTDFSSADIVLSIDVRKPLDIQYTEVEGILTSKFAKSNVVAVLDYVKQCKDAEIVLPKKDFELGTQIASVGGQGGMVSITVFPIDE